MSYPWLQPVAAEFTERLENDRIPHAILLCGPRDTGKTELATQFVASLMCLENQYPACGRCRSCQLLESGAHPDRQIITYEENPSNHELRKVLVVDQVRRLIASLYLTNSVSRRKVALVYPAEAMNISTANALLKTLEEPPGEAVLILVSHDIARLPATIRSRCQRLQVRPPEFEVARDWLCGDTGSSESDSEAALTAASGSPLKARRMLSDGSTENYRLLMTTLQDLRSGRIEHGGAMATLKDVDPELLWSWLSLLAAAEVKRRINDPAAAQVISRLQSVADRNRLFLPTPVRKDFLLQDWLIQWSRLRA